MCLVLPSWTEFLIMAIPYLLCTHTATTLFQNCRIFDKIFLSQIICLLLLQRKYTQLQLMIGRPFLASLNSMRKQHCQIRKHNQRYFSYHVHLQPYPWKIQQTSNYAFTNRSICIIINIIL